MPTTNTPRITVVQGTPRLCCPCGRGFLGQLPVKSDVNRIDGSLSISWYCKTCNETTTAYFPLSESEWAYEPSNERQESPL